MKLKKEYILACFGFIACITILLFRWHFNNDLDQWDESLYITNALRYSIQPDWAPLYSFFYRILLFFSPNPIAAYDLSFVLISSGVFLLVTTVTFLVSRSPIASLIAGLLAFASRANMPVIPKVQAFNFCTIVSLIFFVHAASKNRWRLCFFYFLFVFTIYLRQDNLIYLGLILLYDLWRFRNLGLRELASRFVPIFTIIALLGTILFFQFGNPFQNSRAWLAFVDHFAFAHRELLKSTPGLGLTDREKVGLIFKNATGVASAFKANPKLFFQCVLDYTMAYPGQLLSAMSVKSFSIGTTQFNPSAIFLFFLALAVLAAKETGSSTEYVPIMCLFSGMVILKTFTTTILCAPFAKYLCDLSFFIPTLLIFALRSLWRPQHSFSPYVSVCALLIYSFMALNSNDPAFRYYSGERDFIAAIGKNVKGAGPSHRMFLPAATGIYFGAGTSQFMSDYKLKRPQSKNFGDYARNNAFELVAINELSVDYAKQNGTYSDFEMFLANPSKWGYRRIIPSPYLIFVKANL